MCTKSKVSSFSTVSTGLLWATPTHRDFKFGVQIAHSKSQPMDDKLSLKGAWSRHVTHFEISLPKMSLEQLKLETSNFVHWLAM